MPEISQIYLSILHTFSFYPREDSLNSPFEFLANDDDYYNAVIKDYTFLGKQNIQIQDLGRLRSVLDIKQSINQDSFFSNFREYYNQLSKSGLILTPHYPCAIDILPSISHKYRLDISTLPGSLSSTKEKETKMSISIRIYPAGLAVLRLGLFFTTENSFKIEDIIEFLKRRNTSIEIDGRKNSINELSKEYGRRLLDGLHNENKTLLQSFRWKDTYSIIDLVKTTPLTLKDNFSDVFLPLLCLETTPDYYSPQNFAKNRDMLLSGPESAVSYLPSGDKLDRRKVRRWLRNSMELYYMQNFVNEYIRGITISSIFNHSKNENGINVLNDKIPPKIKASFSAWNYTNIHLQNYPLEKDVWRNRYHETLKILDPNENIKNSNINEKKQLDETVKELGQNSADVASWLRKFIDYFTITLNVEKNASDLKNIQINIIDIEPENEKPKILFLAANPKDEDRSLAGKEASEIEQKIIEAGMRNRLILRNMTAVNLDKLQFLLDLEQTTIVHFSCHGSDKGCIILEDSDGYSKEVTPEVLASLFKIHKDKIRCVVLNACYSAEQANGISESIDCVIGMSKAISVEAATIFSPSFYQAIAFGRNLQQAFQEGIYKIDEVLGIPNSESGIPKLLSRPGIDPSSIIICEREH